PAHPRGRRSPRGALRDADGPDSTRRAPAACAGLRLRPAPRSAPEHHARHPPATGRSCRWPRAGPRLRGESRSRDAAPSSAGAVSWEKLNAGGSQREGPPLLRCRPVSGDARRAGPDGYGRLMSIPTAAAPTQPTLAYALADARGQLLAAERADHPFYAASTIKLHVLLAALQAADGTEAGRDGPGDEPLLDLDQSV